MESVTEGEEIRDRRWKWFFRLFRVLPVLWLACAWALITKQPMWLLGGLVVAHLACYIAMVIVKPQ